MSNNTETMNANVVLHALKDAFPEVGQMRWTNTYSFPTERHEDMGPIWEGVEAFMSKLGSDWSFDVKKEFYGNCEDWDDLRGFMVHITNDVELAKLRDE